jgi:hypothetical protein
MSPSRLTVLALLLALPGAAPQSARAGAASESYFWKHIRIGGGGFVTGIVFHPGVTNLIYCKTDTGGAYRWNEAGSVWEPLLDWFSGAMGVEGLAVDPADGDMLYLSVGEGYGAADRSVVLVSTNRGLTFATYTLPFRVGANDEGRSNGPRMVVDPNYPSLLFYAAHSGLFKSADRGQTWMPVTSFPVTTTTNGVGPNFVQFVQESGSSGTPTPVVFVGVSQAGSNLYRSVDGGTTWSAVSTRAAGGSMMPHRAAQDGLGYMYITFCDAPGPSGVNTGAVLKLNLTSLEARVVTPPTGQGGFAGVSVSREEPYEVAVSTMDRWYPHDVIYLSANGGLTWRDTTTGAKIDDSSEPWAAWHSSDPGPGSWTGDCEIDPFDRDRLMYITGGGIYGTRNLRASSGRVYQTMSTGIEEMGAGSLLSPSSGPLLYTFFWDIGSFALYDLDVSPPDTNYFDPVGCSNTSGDCADAAPWILARLGCCLTNYGAYSTNYGKTWTAFGSCPPAAATNCAGAMAVSANGTCFMWTPWHDDQYASADHGVTWTKSLGGTTNHQGYPAVADRGVDSTFYIYDASNGRFLVSRNGGRSFSVNNSSLLRWGRPPATVFGRAGDIWIPSGNGLCHSTNFGADWTGILPGDDVTAIGFGKAAPGAGYPAIYITAQLAGDGAHDVYRSNDCGISWTRINDDQHRWGIISELCGDPRTYGTVYLGCRCYGNLCGIPVTNTLAWGIFWSGFGPERAGAGSNATIRGP